MRLHRIPTGGPVLAAIIAGFATFGVALGCAECNGPGCAQGPDEQAAAGLAAATPVGRWQPLSLAGAPPEGSVSLAAVWSGAAVVVWGGSGSCTANLACATGSSYDPTVDAWTALPASEAPTARYLHSGTWTSEGLFVFGGLGCGDRINGACGDGAVWSPRVGRWRSVSAGTDTAVPSPRAAHTSMSTGGASTLIWGGADPRAGRLFRDGATVTFNAGLEPTWTPIPTTDAPTARRYHTAVWTGEEMIIWGGDGDLSASAPAHGGGRYNPITQRWSTISAVNAPDARWGHTVVWTGEEMIIWGGLGCNYTPGAELSLCGDGAAYNPARDRWRPLATPHAPTARVGHTAAWTGRFMVIWGGGAAQCADGTSGACADGAAYDPAANTWVPISRQGKPSPRTNHVAVWAGDAMVVWGGLGGEAQIMLADGGVLRLP